MTLKVKFSALLLVLASLLAACGGATTGGATNPTAAGDASTSPTAASGQAAPVANGGPNTIVLGAYTTPREAYGKLIPIFKEQWKKDTGQDLTFQESYQGSGAQSCPCFSQHRQSSLQRSSRHGLQHRSLSASRWAFRSSAVSVSRAGSVSDGSSW